MLVVRLPCVSLGVGGELSICRLLTLQTANTGTHAMPASFEMHMQDTSGGCQCVSCNSILTWL